MRRTWLHGRDNIQKQYLIHVSGYNLGLIMRLLIGFGTPRRWADAKIALIWFSYPIDHQTAGLFGCLVAIGGPHQGEVLGSALLNQVHPIHDNSPDQS